MAASLTTGLPFAALNLPQILLAAFAGRLSFSSENLYFSREAEL